VARLTTTGIPGVSLVDVPREPGSFGSLLIFASSRRYTLSAAWARERRVAGVPHGIIGPVVMEMSPEARKRSVANVFTRAAETYDGVVPFFAHFGRRIVEIAGISTGESVLDVAAGVGAVLLPAARIVGDSGRVTGIDLSEGMIDALNHRIREQGVTNAHALLMDAEMLEFGEAEFDAVICAFGIMFLPDAAGALRGFRRVVRPGGHAAIAVWSRGAPDFKLGELATQFGGMNFDAGPPPPWADAAGLAAMLEAAGFEQVRVVHEEATFDFAGVDEWWRTQMSHGARAYVDFLSPDQREPFRVAARRRYAEVTGTEGAVSFMQRALIGLGRA
jgi:ubiquinone/menaquinone biosynthesis C-methylase UbiE